MKRIFIASILAVLMLASAFTQELTLDEVLQNYFKATGFDKMQKVSTIILTGTITKQTLMPLKITRMRPSKYKMETDVADIYTCQCHDGQTAWEITTPWTGSSKPHIMQPEGAKEIIARADFDGVIYNWEKKGHLAELQGKEKFNDSEVYRIKLTRKDGNTENYFIDSRSFMLVKKSRMLKVSGKDVENISTFTNFRDIEGIKFPFTNENFMDGQLFSIIEYDSIDLNKPVEPGIFEMPIK